MSERDDVPEGVINADPPGGWESEDAADGTTAERNAQSIQKPDLTDSGLPPNVPTGQDATSDQRAEHPDDPADPDEGRDSRDDVGEGG